MTVESVESIPLGPSSIEASSANHNKNEITVEDLHLLCDLFYLPFEHGSKALLILNEFYWLKNNATVLVTDGYVKHHSGNSNGTLTSASKPETVEWHRRAAKFEHISQRVFDLARKLVRCANKEIVYELYSYLWELTGALSLLVGYVEWLKLGQFPQNINSFTQGSYTCKYRGWNKVGEWFCFVLIFIQIEFVRVLRVQQGLERVVYEWRSGAVGISRWASG